MKKIIAMLLVLAMALSLAACGAKSEPAATEAPKAEAPAAEAAAAFEAETGAKVKVEFKGRDLNTVLTAALEAKENIDIFDDDYNRIANAYAAHTYDLTEMAAAAGYD